MTTDIDWDLIQARVEERVSSLSQEPGDVSFTPCWDTPEEFMFSGTLVMLEALGCRRAQSDFEIGSPDWDVLQDHLVATLEDVPVPALKAIIDNMASTIINMEKALEAKNV